MKEFFKKLGRIIEPFVFELIAYSFVVLAFEIVRRFIDVYIDEETRNAVKSIKQIVLIGTLSLFAFHLLISLFIGIVVEINDEYSNFRKKIRHNRISQKRRLQQKPTNVDEVAEIKKARVKAVKIEDRLVKEINTKNERKD